jgi:gas vesicle protein
MRIALVVPLLLLGACNVSKEGNAVTIQYDQNKAENTAADIGNTAQNIAGDIGNDVQKTGDKIDNKVIVNKSTDANGNTTTTTTVTTENKAAK